MAGSKGKELHETIERRMTDLIQEAQAVRESEAFQEYLRVAAKFHKYSFGNVMLIAVQNPDATRVAGYRKWQELGRQVRAGEKGIAILAPIPQYAEVESEETGETRKVQNGIWFKAVHVFDISQTDGDEIPEVDWQGDGRNGELEEALLGYAAELGIETSEYEYRNGPLGWSFKGRIAYSDGGSVPRTIAHELMHELTPEWLQEMGKAAMEGLVDAAATIICLHFGTDVTASSANYIAGWAEDPKELLKGLDRARQVASTVIENVEKRIQASEAR